MKLYWLSLALCALPALPALAGDHLVLQNYSQSLMVEKSGRTTLRADKRIKVMDNEGVRLAFSEFALSYPQSAAKRKSFHCERRDAEGKSDQYLRWDLTKVNGSSGNLLTDVVYEQPGLSKVIAGDVIACQWTIEYDDLSYHAVFTLDSEYPVEQRKLEVNFQEPGAVKFFLLNGAPDPVTQGNRLLWQLGPLPALPQRHPDQLWADQARQVHLSRPALNFYGASYPVGSWAEIAAWDTAISLPRQILDDALKAQVAHLTEGAKTDGARASRIYDWVRDEHRYVAVELGKNGWEPHSPVDVARNKYGDCKDFASLFVTMARAAGLKTALVLVLTRDGGWVQEAFPAPMGFDHEMAAVWLDNQWVFADATHKYLALGDLRSDVEGTRALLIPAEGAATIVTLPVSSADDNHSVWTLTGVMANGVARIKGIFTVHGALAGDFRAGMDSADSAVDLYAIMQRWLSRRLQGGSDYVIAGNFRDVHKPVHIETSANLPGLQQLDEGHRYVRLLPLLFDEEVASGKPVAGAPVLRGRRESTLISMDWTLENPLRVQLPHDEVLESPFGILRMSFQKTPDGIHVDRELSLTRNEISPAEYDAYKAFILKAQELHNQFFDLGPAQ